MKKTTIKLDKKFNLMPGKDKIVSMLKEYDLWDKGETVYDSEKEYWQNSEDTLVLALSANSMLEVGLRVARFSRECGSDEFDYYFENDTKRYIVRFWWD